VIALAMLAGAFILAAGILAGRFLPARRRPAIPKQPDPVCGCGHHYAMHDPEKHMECAVEFGNKMKCACVRYAGPEPLPVYYSPEISEG
jgi:hypothetical protein